MASERFLTTLQKTYVLSKLWRSTSTCSSGTVNFKVCQQSITKYFHLRYCTLLQCHLQSSIGKVRLVHTCPTLTAGHSKWNNIKHIKAANDKEKGQKSMFLASRIQAVFIKNPEKDPKHNTELANLIKWARTNNIPNDVIDRTIDNQIKLRDPKNITVFDGRGMSNTGIIIECFSLKPHHTKGLLQSILKKYGFSLHSPAMDLFEHKGVVEAKLQDADVKSAQSDPKSFVIDKYVDLAIEAEAEEVTLEKDEDGPYLKFLCAPQDVDKVHGNLEKLGVQVLNSERTYLPKIVIPVSQEFLESLDKLIEKLDIHPDVINYHFNVEPEK
ncbi:unnamed protein product [Lymnaea stagnalis]|uniref:Translational activator of cytochrome c oxidase 1 n=1 Tax=Lymnaea stagnalis TaxID=6523 RepID=A0AAV2I2V9_LYMST